MKRVAVFLGVIAVALAFVVAGRLLWTPSASPRPAAVPTARANDVLLVTVDTLRADATGFSGNRRVETPAMDRLAAAGRVFTNAHAHNVMTLPSHANILTGRYPYQHGVRDNAGFVLPETVPTLATVLRDAGFATAAYVGAFPLDARFGLDRGFDVYDDLVPETAGGTPFTIAERPGVEVVARAREWWAAHDGRRRFLWVHLFEPHAPYVPPEPFASRYAKTPYLGEVAATDAALEPLLDEIADSADAERTLVVLTSDHGEGLGEHGELTHAIFAYEATLRVPLVLRGAGVEPGTDRFPARHVDLFPTIVEAAGLALPSQLPGVSLLHAGRTSPDSPASYFEALSGSLSRGWAPLRGTIVDGIKLIDLPLPELYDLEADPAEERNLYAARREAAEALRAGLPEESVWPPRRGRVSPEVEARLRGLGYVGGSAPARDSYGPQDDPKRLIDLDRDLHRLHDLYGRGRMSEVVEMARGMLARRPTMSVAYNYFALALLRSGRQTEAIAVMERARTEGLATETLLHQLALTLTWVGRAPEAVEMLEELVAGAGGEPETLNALGTALIGAQRAAEAVPVLQRVFERDPTNARAHENLSLATQALGLWQESHDHARRALDIDARRPDAWNNLGVARLYLRDPRGAIEAWEEAVRLNPRQYEALLNIGIVAVELGDPQRAREALARFVEIAPAARYAADIARARSILARLEP